MRHGLPASGEDWESLRERMIALASGDVDWRNARTAVYIFNAGEDVLRVAKEAYALYQSENALGPLAFPSLARMEREVVEMGLGLLHAPPEACGNMTSGGSESIFLAVKTCRDQARAQGRDTRGGEIVIPQSAHPAFDKAAHYLDLSVQRVPVGADLRADVDAMAARLGERSLMLVGSAPCFPYGLIDPIKALGALAERHDLWLHVDACVGGYFAPFARMNGALLPAFDFEVPGVRSISSDLHKYGYVSKGASTIFHRSETQRAHQIFEFDDWPAGGMTTPTAAGTRPGGAIACAWAVTHYLGEQGYREKTRIVMETREKMERAIAKISPLKILGEPALGILAFTSDGPDPHAIWGRMLARGWFSSVVTEPRGIQLMLSPAHAAVCDEYLEDLREAILEVEQGVVSGPDPGPRYA